MKQVSFFPGPSRVYAKVPEFLLDAYTEGYMSVNHRSGTFMELVENTKDMLREKLLVPADYEIIFLSSATECWEVIAQSLTQKNSAHFYSGSFGQKWYETASKITETIAMPFDTEQPAPVKELPAASVLCFTQNETSNASQVDQQLLKDVRKRFDGLIAVDTTSSMAGIRLDFTLADIWYASVQKCFGIPAGMAVMFLSPKAVQVAEKIGERGHYNSVLNALDHWRKNQAPYTPNVLDIYLLYRTQKASKGIEAVEKKVLARHADWEAFFENFGEFGLIPENPEVRSKTVLAVQCPNPQEIIEKAAELDITLGKGYGAWRDSTFRIANFPAIKKKEIVRLQKFLRMFC
jgi:phosphoserine aminotransferase